MPTYAYACRDCGHEFDIVQSFTEDSLTTCPECEGRLRKKFNSVGVVFKGSGFYRNDSRAEGSSSQAAQSTSASASGGSSESSTSTSSDSSSGSSASSSSDAGKGASTSGAGTSSSAASPAPSPAGSAA
ncbi:FmdB family zinc ribbon protein [Citricoccus sp. GCM10030269]|uniref:FmdB family zinc ribbon protein n=1 Tax=Citricoccus sp. GCM10030269 TaxID=3273388 RepID=UPI0036203038